MTKIQLAKAAAQLVVSAGTAKIVTSIIKNNTDPENVADTVAIASASFVIASMVGEKTKAHTDALIDQTVAWYTNNVKR